MNIKFLITKQNHELSCESTMDRFLEMDKNSMLPMDIIIHILLCKKCRTQIRALSMAEKSCREPLNIETPLTDESISSLMRKIDPSFSPEENLLKPITFKRWIISGIIMIMTMLFFGTFNFITTDSLLNIYFYIMFAIVITAYCAIFIGSNMDFFIKKFETLK